MKLPPMSCMAVRQPPSAELICHLQAVDSMLALVKALAQQWMGVWLRPRVPSDDWLLQGLAAHLTNLFIAKYLGRNELLFRHDMHLS